MTYPTHYLWNFGGGLGSDEEWSCNIRFANNEPLALLDVTQQAIAQALGQMLAARMDIENTNPTTPGPGISSDADLTYSKFNEIGPDGKYQSESTTNAYYFDRVPGFAGGDNVSYPYQICYGTSWVTDAVRGPASKGRIFVPSPYVAINGSTGTLDNTQTENQAQAWANILKAANDTIALEVEVFTPPVAAVVSAVGAGSWRPITGVRVGAVLDTQRRRRNKLAERYQSATLPTDE